MQELGIQNGDIVKITGGKTTHAFCLTWDDDYDNQNEKNFVCLDKSSKNMPTIKPSDLTYSNLQNRHFGNLVELQKSEAVKATKITIKPLYVLGVTEKKDFNLDWLKEQAVVSKGDRIMQRNDDPKKMLGFFVIDGKPDSQAWIVDKDTPIEVSDIIREDVHRMITAGGNLNSVIPVVQQIKGDDFEATISAIEVYDNCLKIIMYVKDSIVHQEAWTSGLCTPTIRGWDDLRNQYRLNRYSGRGGATQFGDSLWGTTNHSNFSEISCILTPTLDKCAHELTLSIEQLLWDVRKRPMQRRVTPVKEGQPYVMTPVRLNEKFVIHGGPWEFKIKLGEK